MDLKFLNNFNLSESGDWAIFLIFLVTAFIYGIFMGRNRLVMVMMGSYFSFVLVKFIPWKQFDYEPQSNLLIFILLALILGFYFLLPHSAFRSALRGSRKKSDWWQSLILSILQIGLILSMVLSFLDKKVIEGLSPLAQMIFSGQVPQFLWLLMPIAAMMFLKPRQYETAE
jgi:hypothetical protein